MENLKESIKYTIDKKEQQIEDSTSFFVTPNQEIHSFIEGEEDDSVIGLSFDFLSSWDHYQYIYSFLYKKTFNKNSIKTSTLLAIEANNWEFFLCEKFENYDESIQFHKAIKHMAQALLLGWDDLAIKYGNLLIKMLYGKQYKGWHPAYLHPWFMLELFCKWQKIELDYGKLNYPEDMGVYAAALRHWETKDTQLLSQLVDELSDFHIAQSDEDEYEDRTPDFPSSDYFIYAIEILLWLNIRERMGLPDYMPDNELMKLPINNWHTQNTEIPKIELIEKAKQKLMQDYPDISFEL